MRVELLSLEAKERYDTVIVLWRKQKIKLSQTLYEGFLWGMDGPDNAKGGLRLSPTPDIALSLE